MDLHDELPPAVPAKELLALAEDHHARAARPLGTREVAGHLVKTYALEAPGRTVTEPASREALRVAAGHLALGAQRGSLGLAHERDAFARHVPDGTGPLGERLAAWGADTVEGNVR
ncbi:hypothetical protein ACWGA9_38795 [Streptomyces sp. NPDC054950]|uniref:hypothetical protein n=1 Tax=Streptomyces sp. NBC_00723 TaxID=2903673 RepID=UPI0006BAB648|nr:hypothetical protein OV320_1456 [Actinobacteria bacterium OV320]